MATWVDEYLQMIEDCENRESKLTEWEIEFLESIGNRLAADIPLSQKQTETLENIWEKATKNG